MRRFIVLNLDLLLITIATVAALYLRENFQIPPGHLANLLPYMGLTLVIALPVLIVLGLNRLMWRLSSMQVYMRIVLATSLIVLGAVLIGFLGFRLEGISRALPVLQWILMVFLLVGGRVFVRQIYRERAEHLSSKKKSPPTSLHEITEQLDATESILVIGINPVTELYLQAVHQFAKEQITVAGILGRHTRHTGRMIEKCEVLGTQEDVAKIIETLANHGHFINRIVLTMEFDKLSPETQEALLEIEKTTEIKLDILAEKLGLTGGKTRDIKDPASRPEIEDTQDALLFSMSDNDLADLLARPYWQVKRLFDLAFATILVLVLAPVMALLALLVAVDIGMPIIFWQNRPGFAGRPFYIYKFRTMRGEHNSHGQKLSMDERQTNFGWFLRRTRLDELPQLFNILMGDMSFIGPRPLLPADQSRSFAARLLVRPGLSGWAQVHGGRDVSPTDKAALDVWYVDNASLALDLKIFSRTIDMVIFGERSDLEIIGKTWKELQHAGLGLSISLAGGAAIPSLSPTLVSPKENLNPSLLTEPNAGYNNFENMKPVMTNQDTTTRDKTILPQPAIIGGSKSPNTTMIGNKKKTFVGYPPGPIFWDRSKVKY